MQIGQKNKQIDSKKQIKIMITVIMTLLVGYYQTAFSIVG